MYAYSGLLNYKMAFAQLLAKVSQRMANMMHHVMIPLQWISYNQILNFRCLCIYTYNCAYRFTVYITLQQIRIYVFG